MAEFGLWADVHVRRLFNRIDDEEEKSKAFRFLNAVDAMGLAEDPGLIARQEEEMHASADAWLAELEASGGGEGVRQ